MKTNFYLTTAIPYANARPHIGTAMDYLYGDIILRYQLSQNKNAKMSIGTDEHGTKVAEIAAENNLTPQEWVDNLQKDFEKMRAEMNLDFSHILNTRTTDAAHVARVQEIWRILASREVNSDGIVREKITKKIVRNLENSSKNSQNSAQKIDENSNKNFAENSAKIREDFEDIIYKNIYEGWYCAGCEAFITETEAREMNFVCADHNKKLEKLREENYYLRVSKFTEKIREFARENIVPEFRGKEILELIKNGAQDVSISRPREKLAWGIPVPDDENQTMYVWVDALSNYITALKFPEKNWQKDFWPADVEIVGKDILRFHAIIWPAMLLALGLELPKKLMVHGFVNVAGAKMSKSVGNVVSPLEIIENYGADAFRYFFARHIPTFDDGDFTWEKFENAYNGELANDLGNLVSRVANMIKKYCGGKIPSGEYREKFEKGETIFDKKMREFDLNGALEILWKGLQDDNKYIDDRKPWKLAKSVGEDVAEKVNEFRDKIWPLENVENYNSQEEMDEKNPARSLFVILWNLSDNLRGLGELLAPFLPETSAKIREIFSGENLPDEIPILFPKKYLHSEEPKRK